MSHKCRQCQQPAVLWQTPTCKMDCSYGWDLRTSLNSFHLHDRMQAQGKSSYLAYSNAGDKYIKEFNRYNEES